MERWQSLPLAERLGRVGSEVARALHWQRAGEQEQTERSMERALELLDATVEIETQPARRWELLRLREVLCDTLYGSNLYGTSPQYLDEYFLPFAHIARKWPKVFSV